jgi:hypothetical protein
MLILEETVETTVASTYCVSNLYLFINTSYGKETRIYQHAGDYGIYNMKYNGWEN